MKKIITYILTFTILICTMICFAGCGERASSFTEEEHIQRITERIKKRDPKRLGFPEGETYQDFQVYPLYNEDDKLEYALIEYEPYGFDFVMIQDEPPVLTAWLHANISMYVIALDVYGICDPWTPYIRDKNSPLLPSLKEGWTSSRTGELILDENGEIILYNRSPYFVIDNTAKKKYLLKTNDSFEYICAVKKDQKFVNLISGLEFKESKEYIYEENATLRITFRPSRYFDL